MAERKPRLNMDYNASAPLRPQARDAMIAALDVDANPSSTHAGGRAARALVEKSRREVGALFSGQAKQVVFTSGATEAANFVLTPDWQMGRGPLHFSRLYVAATAHPCLLSGGRFASEQIVRIGSTEHGTLDIPALEGALKAHDVKTGLPLVAVPAACNETGVIQPIEPIATLARIHGATLVIDAVQMAGRLPIDLAMSTGDYFIVSAHKIGGPRGVGALVSLSDVLMPAPLIKGGGQEKGHRAGTENTLGIVGFGAAVKAAQADMDEARWADVERQRDTFEQELKAVCPSVMIHGEVASRLPNTSFFTLPDIKAETAQIALDLEGIAVSAGSACSSGKVGPSHVLKAMGADRPEGAARVSFGPETSLDDIQTLLSSLRKLLKRNGDAKAA
ncbi:cysteine desulfurase family protein [Notoacmeibacter ruber]|uniref:Cysteine desulfurase n=1 Tax=Notoacmeibacter ruber TaxID=2670375 RepID=A0A3L7JAJ8_9HYPH|nr:cysteine desulfurase family protein [Notoacmeibacter ruber]RLQ87768.1 cysteine desulfurase [Notoacmeibacter ruber]